jgi:hypothetical protein
MACQLGLEAAVGGIKARSKDAFRLAAEVEKQWNRFPTLPTFSPALFATTVVMAAVGGQSPWRIRTVSATWHMMCRMGFQRRHRRGEKGGLLDSKER